MPKRKEPVGPVGQVHVPYQYLRAYSINCLLLGSRSIPNGTHTNHCWANLAHASKCIKTLTLGWLSGSLYNQSKTASSFTPSPNAVWSKHLVEKRNLFYHYMYMWPNFQKGKLSWKIIWTNIYLQLLTILYKWMKFGIQEDLSFMFLRDQISCTTWLNDNKKCVYCIIYVVMEVASFRRTCPIN